MSSFPSRVCALLLLGFIVAACSGDQVAAPADEAAIPTTNQAVTTTEAPTTTTVAAPTTAATAETVPETLAFASTRDLGRMFVLDPAAEITQRSSEPGQDADLGELAADAIVQAVGAKSRNGGLWVEIIEATSASELGWIPAESLMATDETVIQTDADEVGQFRRVVRVSADSFLNVRSSPVSGADAVTQLGPNATFMHGGQTATAPDGSTWVDVVDSQTRELIGWVIGDFVASASGIEIQTADGVDAAQRAASDVTYGASIGSAGVTAVGCNSVQITITGDSDTRGLRVIAGPTEPEAFALNSGLRWASTGGRETFIAPGQTVVFTVPSTGSFTWWILPLDSDGQALSTTATGGGTVINAGEPDAAQAFAYPVDASYCGDAPTDDGFRIPGIEVQSSGVADGTEDVEQPGTISDAGDGTTTDESNLDGQDNSGTSPGTTVPASGDPESAAPEGFSTTGGS
jgi:hypothetical protein